MSKLILPGGDKRTIGSKSCPECRAPEGEEHLPLCRLRFRGELDHMHQQLHNAALALKHIDMRLGQMEGYLEIEPPPMPVAADIQPKPPKKGGKPEGAEN